MEAGNRSQEAKLFHPGAGLFDMVLVLVLLQGNAGAIAGIGTCFWVRNGI